MSNELSKSYNAKEHEDGIYLLWEQSGFFNPDHLPKKRKSVFSIAMPPPNVTGTLHMGHAVMLALEDIMTRYHRMKGDKTLWLPGLDHAAIATQNVVEKKILKEEGKTRHDLGREEFLQRAEAFAEQSKIIIRNQIKKMGASCDWSRERYTLDEGLTKAVRTQFVNMYNDGLIYRGNRMVNWCVRCQSTLADDEVDYKEQPTKLYVFRYDENFPEDLAIATTRPETKLGDTAVALNPQDPRAKKYAGKKFIVDIGAGPQEIRIINDEQIDITFGTGAVGVTPAHSAFDAQLAEKYALEAKSVIDERGKIKTGFGEYSGLSVRDAREKLVASLRDRGLLIKEEEVTHNLSVCYRCGKPIEPLISKQWFIAVDKPVAKLGGKTLKEKSLAVVRDGSVTIIPDNFTKIYCHWMEHLHDWCVSRQIWFGHRIPVWYKGEKIYVGVEAPSSDGWEQDPDTLDTWFSSGLWTFSTLGWPEKTKDLKTFHPTSVMETGYDILPLWVARMILMTEYALGEIPFKTVYLHGLVRDRHGKKMSKSAGNGIDPLDMIAKYGADATRLSLFVGTAPGNDTKLYEEKIAGYRNFANKLWNISRFVQMQIGAMKSVDALPVWDALALPDKWILLEFTRVRDAITKNLDAFAFSPAADMLYEFTWHELADWYLEIVKTYPKEQTQNGHLVLQWLLERLLALWHPFIPFVTEKLYQEIYAQEKNDVLMAHDWPEVVALDMKNQQAGIMAKFETTAEKITAMRVEGKKVGELAKYFLM